MLRVLLFSLIFLCLLGSSPAKAQRAVVASGKSTGTVVILNQAAAKVKVHYSLTPAYPDNITALFHAPQEFFLRAHMVDAKGQEVLPIAATQVKGRYVSSLNVAGLQPGHYFVEVFTSASASTFRVPFDIVKP